MNKEVGLIYQVQKYKETSLLLFLYTKRGKITLLATGALKVTSKLRTAAQYLTFVEFEDQKDKDFIKVYELDIINDLSLIKNDLFLMEMASLVTESIKYLLVDNNDANLIYQQIYESLTNDLIKESIISFLLKQIIYLGYPLNLLGDGRDILGFSIENGSLVYQNEKKYIDLDISETIKLLKLVKLPYYKLEKLDNEDIKTFINFIINYYNRHIEYQFKILKKVK